jgi:hypothetical protein
MMNLSFESQKIKHKHKLELNKTGFDFALVYISEGTLVSKGNNLKFSKENLLFLNKDFETPILKTCTLYNKISDFLTIRLISSTRRLY